MHAPGAVPMPTRVFAQDEFVARGKGIASFKVAWAQPVWLAFRYARAGDLRDFAGVSGESRCAGAGSEAESARPRSAQGGRPHSEAASVLYPAAIEFEFRRAGSER